MSEAITAADWDAVTEERKQDLESPEQKAPPAERVEQQPLEAKQPEAEVFASLSPEVQAKLSKFDEMAAFMPQLVNELREAKGRIGALQSQWDKTRQNVEQPSQRQVAAAAQNPDRWEALKKDFPEWGDAISEFVETRLGSLTAAPTGPTSEQIEQLVAQRTEAATTDLRKTLNESLVTVKHPTWRKEVNTQAFGDWFQTQPGDIQALASSPDGFDAIRMLDLYTEHKARPVKDVKDQRQQRLAAAASSSKPGTGGGSVSKTFEEMTGVEQWEYLAREREKRSA
jgi:hypothetical protein